MNISKIIFPNEMTETLLIMLYIRAAESHRPDALIKDDIAVALVRQMDRDFFAEQAGKNR